MALHHYLHASSHKMKHADSKSLSDQLKDSTNFFFQIQAQYVFHYFQFVINAKICTTYKNCNSVVICYVM